MFRDLILSFICQANKVPLLYSVKEIKIKGPICQNIHKHGISLQIYRKFFYDALHMENLLEEVHLQEPYEKSLLKDSGEKGLYCPWCVYFCIYSSES